MAKSTTKKTGEFRPKSYWNIEDPLSAILAHISGKERRKLIKNHWNAGRFNEINDELLKDDLSVDTRIQLGRIHPCFMGGEYLPERYADEVTIVTIGLESVTSDVIELRARRLGDGCIGLRWVDEYNGKFSQPCDEITQPFSFDELTDFIEGSSLDDLGGDCLTLAYNEFNNIDGDVERLRNFSSFGSKFYPRLSGWHQSIVDKWIKDQTVDEEEE